MMARKKTLTVVPPVEMSPGTKDNRFEKPAPKGPVKLVDSDKVGELIELLHKEAKVI
jgi:electron transfer flavoprotein beta subunit